MITVGAAFLGRHDGRGPRSDGERPPGGAGRRWVVHGRRNWPVWVAGGYAVAVLATSVWVQVAASGAEDASFAGIWLVALTIPGSLLALLVLPGEVGSLVEFTVVGLLQAWGTWYLLSRRRARRDRTSVRG